jgi:hypothetical protein
MDYGKYVRKLRHQCDDSLSTIIPHKVYRLSDMNSNNSESSFKSRDKGESHAACV